ncbi:MAG TPA: DUF983 domain-containing protein [Pseudorhodoplanes sp.]|nr:DUF983 domain-containing protein [Pseudorhodoplanes sp.]
MTTERDSTTALHRGLLGRCPNCAQGKLFRAFLKVADRCEACGEELHHHQADDAPAYFNIVIVGHIVAPLVLIVETTFAPAYWVHLALWFPLIIGLSFGLMQPIKGAIVAWQWAHRMHGFDRQTAPDDPQLGPAAKSPVP